MKANSPNKNAAEKQLSGTASLRGRGGSPDDSHLTTPRCLAIAGKRNSGVLHAELTGRRYFGCAIWLSQLADKIMLTRFGISSRLPDKHAKMDYSTSMSVMAPLVVCAPPRMAKAKTVVTARENRKDEKRAISRFQQKEIS